METEISIWVWAVWGGPKRPNNINSDILARPQDEVPSQQSKTLDASPLTIFLSSIQSDSPSSPSSTPSSYTSPTLINHFPQIQTLEAHVHDSFFYTTSSPSQSYLLSLTPAFLLSSSVDSVSSISPTPSLSNTNTANNIFNTISIKHQYCQYYIIWHSTQHS